MEDRFREAYERLCSIIGARVRHLEAVLTELGLSRRPDRERFNRKVVLTAALLRSDAADKLFAVEKSGGKRKLLATTLAGLGLHPTTVEPMVRVLFDVELDLLFEAAEHGTQWAPSYTKFGELVRYLDEAFARAITLFGRLITIEAELEAPFAGTEARPDKGVAQVVDLLEEFPGAADELYAAMGWNQLRSFPPIRSGTHGGEAEMFRRSVAKELRARRRTRAIETAGLVVFSVVLGVFTGGATWTGLLAGAGIGLAAGVAGVASAVDEAQRAQLAHRLGLASSEHVRFHRNEVVAALGQLPIIVASLGLASRFGGGELIKQLGQGIALGTTSGASSALVNPNVWADDDMVGLVLEAAAGGAALGTGAAVVGHALAPRTLVGIPRVPGGREPGIGDVAYVQRGRSDAPVVGVIADLSPRHIVVATSDRTVRVPVGRVTGLTASASSMSPGVAASGALGASLRPARPLPADIEPRVLSGLTAHARAGDSYRLVAQSPGVDPQRILLSGPRAPVLAEVVNVTRSTLTVRTERSTFMIPTGRIPGFRAQDETFTASAWQPPAHGYGLPRGAEAFGPTRAHSVTLQGATSPKAIAVAVLRTPLARSAGRDTLRFRVAGTRDGNDRGFVLASADGVPHVLTPSPAGMTLTRLDGRPIEMGFAQKLATQLGQPIPGIQPAGNNVVASSPTVRSVEPDTAAFYGRLLQLYTQGTTPHKPVDQLRLFALIRQEVPQAELTTR